MNQKPPKDWEVYLVLLALPVLFALWLYANEWLYGDWRCAFAQCRIDK